MAIEIVDVAIENGGIQNTTIQWDCSVVSKNGWFSMENPDKMDEQCSKPLLVDD